MVGGPKLTRQKLPRLRSGACLKLLSRRGGAKEGVGAPKAIGEAAEAMGHCQRQERPPSQPAYRYAASANRGTLPAGGVLAMRSRRAEMARASAARSCST